MTAATEPASGDDITDVSGPPENPDRYLYHYTSASGLTGIFREQALWATDALYMNDELELSFAAPTFVDEMVNRGVSVETSLSPEQLADLDTETPEWAVLEGVRIAISTIKDYLKLKATQFDSHLHVACLCAKGDVLSQWRGYANGNGFAIAFDTDELKRIWPNPGDNGHGHQVMPTLKLDRVRYGDLGAAGRQTELAELVDRIIPPDDVWYSSHPMRPWRVEWDALQALAYVKHSAFDEEQEYRLTFCLSASMANDPPVDFRPDTRFGLVPFIRLPFRDRPGYSRDEGLDGMSFSQMGPETQAEILLKGANERLGRAIRGVVIGPGGDRKLREATVRRLFKRHEMHSAKIWHSAAPFRG